MNCPKCNQQMEGASKDISNNPRDSKLYERTIYVSKTDDIWVTVETPQE